MKCFEMDASMITNVMIGFYDSCLGNLMGHSTRFLTGVNHIGKLGI